MAIMHLGPLTSGELGQIKANIDRLTLAHQDIPRGAMHYCCLRDIPPSMIGYQNECTLPCRRLYKQLSKRYAALIYYALSRTLVDTLPSPTRTVLDMQCRWAPALFQSCLTGQLR